MGILVLLGMSAMAAAIGALMFSTADALFVRQARADLLRQNQAVAHEIDDLTDRAAASLLIARNSPAFDRYFEAAVDDEAARAAALSDIQSTVVYLQQTFSIDEICLIDAQGAEVARGVLGGLAGPEDLSSDEADNPFFGATLVLANGQVYRSTEPYLSPDTHRWVVAHATPIVLPDGRHAGILHFEIPLEWFATKVRDASLAGSSSYLLDREGHVLVHNDLDVRVPATDGKESPVVVDGDPRFGFPHAIGWGSASFRLGAREALQNASGTTTFQDGERGYELVYQPVFADHWILATELPHTVIYAPGAELLRQTLILVAPLLAIAVALMIWYSARFLSPLQRLTQALTAIGSGDLEQVAGISSEDEIGELGVAFDRMAGELRASLQRQAAAEAALMHRATHDALTELPNRALLQDRLNQAVATAARSHIPFALMLMDLDRFKEVNDTLGHQAGDRLLQEVAQRLVGELRSCDTVARLGGDEFAVLLPEADAITAPSVADRLIEVLEKPIVIDGREVTIGASIGIGVHSLHGHDGETLMRRADVAMYAAKRGRHGHMLATVECEEPDSERLGLIGALRTAIDTGQLVLHYQPIVDCASGRIEAVEALVRWQHPRHGLVGPDRFIPLAEETGLIAPLTRWVLGAAVWQLHCWQAQGLAPRVAVNLSAHDVQDPALVRYVATILQESGVAADRLTLELTETAVMANPEGALEVLGSLAALGVRIAIDDFGTGYSSLSYLTRFPAHELKIDGSFVRQLGSADSRHAAVVRSTIELGHSLGMAVVAEGVEDPQAVAHLHAFGCEFAQGYAIARPLAAQDLQWAGIAHALDLKAPRAA
jgi:diguanylate cyclase (GGDEF)-like protein